MKNAHCTGGLSSSGAGTTLFRSASLQSCRRRKGSCASRGSRRTAGRWFCSTSRITRLWCRSCSPARPRRPVSWCLRTVPGLRAISIWPRWSLVRMKGWFLTSPWLQTPGRPFCEPDVRCAHWCTPAGTAVSSAQGTRLSRVRCDRQRATSGSGGTTVGIEDRTPSGTAPSPTARPRTSPRPPLGPSASGCRNRSPAGPPRTRAPTIASAARKSHFLDVYAGSEPLRTLSAPVRDFTRRNPSAYGHMTDRGPREDHRPSYMRSSKAIWPYQDKRSVKPSAQPTLVRTQHLPHPGETARWLRKRGPAGRFLLVPPCIRVCHRGSMHSSGYGHMADSVRAERAVRITAPFVDPRLFCLVIQRRALAVPSARPRRTRARWSPAYRATRLRTSRRSRPSTCTGSWIRASW